jgi:hypothetical protein
MDLKSGCQSTLESEILLTVAWDELWKQFWVGSYDCLIMDTITKLKRDCRSTISLQAEDHVVTHKLKNKALHLALLGALNGVPMVQCLTKISRCSAPRRRWPCARIRAPLNADNNPRIKRSRRGWTWCTVDALSLIHLPATWPRDHHHCTAVPRSHAMLSVILPRRNWSQYTTHLSPKNLPRWKLRIPFASNLPSPAATRLLKISYHHRWNL